MSTPFVVLVSRKQQQQKQVVLLHSLWQNHLFLGMAIIIPREGTSFLSFFSDFLPLGILATSVCLVKLSIFRSLSTVAVGLSSNQSSLFTDDLVAVIANGQKKLVRSFDNQKAPLSFLPLPTRTKSLTKKYTNLCFDDPSPMIGQMNFK